MTGTDHAGTDHAGTDHAETDDAGTDHAHNVAPDDHARAHRARPDGTLGILTSQGAEVVWVGLPPMPLHLMPPEQRTLLNKVFRISVKKFLHVAHFISTTALLGGPNGEFVEYSPNNNGKLQHIRRISSTRTSVRRARPASARPSSMSSANGGRFPHRRRAGATATGCSITGTPTLRASARKCPEPAENVPDERLTEMRA
ncbi:MAG: hypothetical protein ACRDWD_13815 [Acidimicrobiia bacterium]